MTDIITPGSLFIKHMLPTKEARDSFNPTEKLDKKKVQSLVISLIRHGGPEATKTINELGQLFFDKATEHGYTTPLADYDNDSEERKVLLDEFEHKLNSILSSSRSKEEKEKLIDELAVVTQSKVYGQNINYMLGKGSTAAKMAQTGARGNKDQLGAGTSSPLLGRDVLGRPLPIAIKHSFAEGLSPAEHIAMSYTGRANTVTAQDATRLPGALFKKITPNLFKDVITIPDCGTRNGVMISVEDKPALIGKFEAETNRLIDEKYVKDCKDSKKKKLKVRSVLSCEAHEGVCQKCYGIAGNGRLPSIGENVGVIAAQSTSEVLTQSVLSTKHSSSIGRRRSLYESVSNLEFNPDNFQDEATISTRNGTISHIEETALKDHKVYVDSVPHFVPRVFPVKVQVGDTVRAGQALSDGVVNPRDYIRYDGMGHAREYLARALRSAYDENGNNLDPRHFDLIARNLIKYVEVQDPGHTGYLPGQIVEVNKIKHNFAQGAKDTPITSAGGKTLATTTLSFTPGTILNENHLDAFKEAGIKSVKTTNSSLSVRPIVAGLTTNKRRDEDWISRLASSHLADTLIEAGSLGQKSAIHGVDPIAPYIMGTEFGEGEHGKY